jgi:dihydroorotate dehydrogenase (NAD+) catalytic subunit
MGGIMDANDAIEFMLAGSTAIQVGTANFIDPQAPIKILRGIQQYLERHHIDDVNDLVGALRIP